MHAVVDGHIISVLRYGFMSGASLNNHTILAGIKLRRHQPRCHTKIVAAADKCKRRSVLGKSTNETPCPDCIEGKMYREVNGKWEKAAKV